VTQPVSLLPELPGWLLPPASSTPGLADDEARLITGLATRLSMQSVQMRIKRSYYEGTQRLFDLGVSIPPQLSGVRTVVDWPRISVDPLVQRCVVDGFRLPGDTDADEDLLGMWQANNLDAEAPLCFLDSFVCGRGYMIVGSGDSVGDPPLITVESPFNLAVQWDPRKRAVLSAYQAYEVEGVFRAALYLPDQTVFMSRLDLERGWQVDDRDQHGFGEVPVVRFPNRARSDLREGMSEITPAVMNTTDSTCRTLLAMEVAREFYAIPHRYLLGATEADFVDASGNPKSALDMVMSKFLAFERDDEGQVPTVGQFQAFDPSVFTKIIDEQAQLMASYTQFPPQWFGQTSTANPASADAIRVSQDGVNRRAMQAQNQFSDPLETVMRLAWRFANNGADVPDEFSRMETGWMDVATPTPSADSEAYFRQVQMGAIPATSDVTLTRLGYSAVERARLAQDRQLDAGASVLAELATSLQAKEARVDTTIARDINPSVVNPPNTAAGNDGTGSSAG
jgi:hypothetical protein